jgi:hypothetical protein
MQYLAIITVDVPGRCAATIARMVTVTSTMTKLDIYNYMRDEVASQNSEFTHAIVVFFSAEPNVISA